MKKNKGMVRRAAAIFMAAVMTVTMIPGNGSVLAAEVNDTSMIDQDVGDDPAFSEEIPADVSLSSESVAESVTVESEEENAEAVTESFVVPDSEATEPANETEPGSESPHEEEYVDENTNATEDTVTYDEDVSGKSSLDENEENGSDKTPTFHHTASDVSTAGMDFSSMELLIETDDTAIFTWDTTVVSEYNGVYLTRYSSIEETACAYAYYSVKASYVSPNSVFSVSDTTGNGEEIADLSNLNEGDDALSILNDMDAVRTPIGTVALIDTGVNDGTLVDAVSVIGEDASDLQGHGSRMYQAMREEYPDVKILSIKAMGADGKGQASDIYAAIQYAINCRVNVINLSLTANSTETNSVVVHAIEEAISRGIIVVGAAGNNASNAKYFIPGCVKDAYIIGAADEKGDRLSDSNYGPNVDYEVIAGSTSEASARFSALYVRSQVEGKIVTDYQKVLINYDRTDLAEDDYVLLYDSDDFTVSRPAQSKSISVTVDGNTYKVNVPSYLVFPIYVNATDTSKSYGFAGYRNAANAKDYLGSRTFNAATGMMPTGGGESETTYASITKNCGTYFNMNNTVDGLPDSAFKNAYGTDATAHGASDVCIYGANPDYQTTPTGWTENWYNKGYRVLTAKANDLYSFSVFCTEAKDMSPRGAYGQLIMLPITTNNDRGYADYKVTEENGTKYLWVPYRTDEVDQNAFSAHSSWQNFIGGTYLKVPIEEEQWFASVWKDGNKINGEKDLADAIYGLYDTNVEADLNNDHLVAMFNIDKDGYAQSISIGTNGAFQCKAYATYLASTGWNGTFTYKDANNEEHTQRVLCMNKESLTAAAMNGKKFVWKELRAPLSGKYALNPTIYPATITKAESLDDISDADKVKMTDAAWDNGITELTLIKESDASGCDVSGNPNYSLAGAEYKLYKDLNDARTAAANGTDFSKALATFTVKADGTSNTVKIKDEWMDKTAAGKYEDTPFFIVESKAGKNYLRSNEATTVTVTPQNVERNPAIATVSDVPVNDPFNIRVTKTSPLPDGKSLAGAEFTVDFYAADITKNYTAAELKKDHADKKIAGYSDKITTKWSDAVKAYVAYYTKTALPLGYIVVTETKAPADYMLEGAKVTINGDDNYDITGNLVFICDAALIDNDTDYDTKVYHPSYPDLNLATPGNNVIVSITDENQPIRGNVEVNKADVVTGDPMEGVRFRIDQIDNGQVIETHYIYTDAAGHATTVTNAYANTNYYDGPKDYDQTEATVWFGKKADGTTDPIDGFAALPAGDYRITEEKCAANTGYQMIPPQDFTIDRDHTLFTYQTYTDGKAYNVPKPEVSTVATAVLLKDGEQQGEDVKMCPATDGRTIRDVVTYKNLRVDTEYTLVGRIMEIKDDGTVVPFMQGDAEVVVTKTFRTAPASAGAKTDLSANGEVEVLFENLDFTGLQDRQYVVYETLYLGTVTEGDGILKNYADANPEDEDFFPVDHSKPDDAAQQFHTPIGGTEAKDQTGTKTVTYTRTVTLKDKVEYKGLEIGREYELTGTLYVRPANAESKPYSEYTKDELDAMVLKDKAGNPVTATKVHKPDAPDGSVEVTFTFDADLLTKEEETLVVFEEEKDKKTGITVFTHADINDRGQTVYHPEISTTAKDVNGRSELAAEEEKFYDEIAYKNLEPDTEYRIYGAAMNKKTGQALTLGGVEVTASDTFTTGESNRENGAVDDSFTLEFIITTEMQKDLPGVDMVIFETLMVKDKESGEWITAAQHSDLDDVGQELKVPTLGTTLLDSKTGTHAAHPEEEMVLIDYCSYSNLIPGKKYVIEGVLKNKQTKEDMLDKDNNRITGRKEFTASETGEGIVEVEFKFNASILYIQGTSIVAFEECKPINDKIPVCVHMDIEDKEQTVDIPKVGTKAGLVVKSVTDKTATFVVTDQIMYSNLNTDYEYVAKGWLVDMNGNKVTVNGAELSAEKTFKPNTPDGSVDVTFPEFTCGKYDSIKYVVYEEVYVKVKDEDGQEVLKLVGEHKDLTDSNQTVTYSDSPKTGDDTPVALLLGFFVLAMAGIGVVIWKKRKMKKED